MNLRELDDRDGIDLDLRGRALYLYTCSCRSIALHKHSGCCAVEQPKKLLVCDEP